MILKRVYINLCPWPRIKMANITKLKTSMLEALIRKLYKIMKF